MIHKLLKQNFSPALMFVCAQYPDPPRVSLPLHTQGQVPQRLCRLFGPSEHEALAGVTSWLLPVLGGLGAVGLAAGQLIIYICLMVITGL